jgi:glycosyltransferase involved in cell wall biosynthesis
MDPAVNCRRRTVLVLAFQFPPETGSIQRVTRYVQYLPDFGWDPVVLTRRVDSHALADASLLGRVAGRAKIRRVGPFPLWRRIRAGLAPRAASVATKTGPPGGQIRLNDKGFRGIARACFRTLRRWLLWPDEAIFWLPSALFAALRQMSTRKVDAVYTVSPPHSAHLVGAALKRLTGVRWVADFRDPWVNDPDLIVPTRLHRAAHSLAEIWVLKNADHLVTTTDFHTRYFRSRLPREASGRVQTITNGYDAEEVAGLPVYDGQRFDITYAGGFCCSRKATPFLRALSQLRARAPGVASQVFVRLIGGPNPPLEAEVAAFDLQGQVEFTGHLPHRRALEELARSAVLLLSVGGDYIAQISVPAKLFEYMAIRRPVLAITPPGAAAALVEESGCGVVLHPDDVDGIERAILEYYRQFQRGELHAASAPEVLRRFERRGLTETLSRLLAGVETLNRGDEELTADAGQG